MKSEQIYTAKKTHTGAVIVKFDGDEWEPYNEDFARELISERMHESHHGEYLGEIKAPGGTFFIYKAKIGGGYNLEWISSADEYSLFWAMATWHRTLLSLLEKLPQKLIQDREEAMIIALCEKGGNDGNL